MALTPIVRQGAELTASQGVSVLQNMSYIGESTTEVVGRRSLFQELDFASQKEKVGLVSTRLSLPEPKIGPGTIAAALAALSMAVFAHFFI